MTDTTDLIGHLFDAIDRAKSARQSDFTLSPPGVPAVRRPQHCNCGANPLISVAHLDTCRSRR